MIQGSETHNNVEEEVEKAELVSKSGRARARVAVCATVQFVKPSATSLLLVCTHKRARACVRESAAGAILTAARTNTTVGRSLRCSLAA
eukprot:2957624-Pleurochrysis_carterae.AAC.1